MPLPALALVPAVIAGAVRLIAPKVLRSALGKKIGARQVTNDSITKRSAQQQINLNRNAITSERKLLREYKGELKRKAKQQISGESNYNYGNPGSIKGKASGGTIKKNYAHGGSVRKAKYKDS